MNKKNILWVDNDMYDIDVVLYSIEKEFNITKFEWLPEAYIELKENSDKYDLIILDILMTMNDEKGKTHDWGDIGIDNNKNGIKLLIKLRDELKIDVPVVILSVIPNAVKKFDEMFKSYQPIYFIHKNIKMLKSIKDTLNEILEN